MLLKTGERIIPEEFEYKEDYFIYLRHLFAYEFAIDRILKNSLVLEVGSGEGYGTNLLSQTFRIIGIDVDKKSVFHASKKYGSEKCKFNLYDGINIPYKNDTFDAIISFQVIEHVDDDINYISEIDRVLKNNGLFILTTPNKTYRLKPGQKPWNRFHKREYSQQELKDILINKFLNIEILGIHGIEEVLRIEMNRIDKIQRIISFDPLNLRSLIPEPIKIQIIKILRKVIHKNNMSKRDMSLLAKNSIKYYYLDTNNIENSLELLCICKK